MISKYLLSRKYIIEIECFVIIKKKNFIFFFVSFLYVNDLTTCMSANFSFLISKSFPNKNQPFHFNVTETFQLNGKIIHSYFLPLILRKYDRHGKEERKEKNGKY